MKEFVKNLCKEYEPLLLEFYKKLHKEPELSFEEYNTANFIREKLTEYGISIMEGISGTSTVGILDSNKKGPTIAFRADIDALPVTEKTGLEYASCIPGVMHACGHDDHTATLLCFAKLLSEHKELLKGKVKFLFQAAEEKLPGGALGLCSDGAIEDCDEVYGFHCAGALDKGEIEVNIGANSADICVYQVTVHGKGGHGSSPHNALNPVPLACMMLSAMNQLLAEKVNPNEVAVLTTAYIKNLGGNYPNIIDSDVIFGGNLRTLNHKLTLDLIEKMKKLTEGMAASFGMSAEFNSEIGYHSTVNTKAQALLVRKACEEMGYPWKSTQPGLGGEDFSYYLEKRPGCYFSIGMNDPKKNPNPAPHHNSYMKLDLESLIIGLEMELAVYLKAIE